MPSHLLDTNIIVDTLRKNPAAVQYVDSLGDWSYSVVCKMELIAGARNQKEVDALDKYLRDFTEVALSPEIGTRACDIMKQYAKANGMDPLDAMVAATAITSGLKLVTQNDKHFRNIKGLSFEVPEY